MAETQEYKTEAPPVLTAEGRYDQMATVRSPYLERARECAALTIPGLLPPEGSSGATMLPTPFQSVGAEGINNLSSKMMLALFPPGGSFFRLDIDEFVAAKIMEKAESQDARGEFEKALGKVERAVVKRLEQGNARAVLSETFKHLLLGNALLHVGPKGRLKLYPLSRYVVSRDLSGNPLEMILREGLSKASLPPEARAIYETHGKNRDGADDPTKSIWLYTRIVRKDRFWKVHQEICGHVIESTKGSYPLDKNAFIPLRWNAVDGEDYGRGLVEEYLGDLQSLEGLQQSIVEFSAAAAKILFLVDEAGTTSKKTLQDAPSGAFVDGDAEDITTLQLDKFPDFKITADTAEKIESRLKRAFLLNSSIQRQAERVTAEEIRIMAGELEQALGGPYSTLSQELQLPLVIRLMSRMEAEGELPVLPKDVVSPKIITGLDGLGRSSDLTKLDLWISGIQQLFGPEAVAREISVRGYAGRRATALGLESEGLLRTEQEIAAADAQAQRQAMIEKLGPPTINALSKSQSEAQSQPQ
jgi:hypothetical protein